MKKSLFLVICLSVATAALPQSAEKPTISVAKTDAQQTIAVWQPATGAGMANMFITEFGKLSNIKVVESVALDDLRAEQDLGKHGEVAAAESVKKGNWEATDYTFKSTMTRFGNKSSRTSLGPLPVKFGKTISEAQIDWRIVDNATREIVACGQASGEEKGSSVNVMGAGTDNEEFRDSALGKATMRAISNIVVTVSVLKLPAGKRAAINQATAEEAKKAQRNVKGIVKMVKEKSVWVSLGAKQGFAIGDKVKIYKPVDEKNSKGEVITTTYEGVGEVILSKSLFEK